MNTIDASNDLRRRDFIKGGSLATAMLMMGAVPMRAAEAQPEAKKPEGPALNFGVIGCGFWARELLPLLSARPGAVPGTAVVALADTYEPFLNRAKTQHAPNAETYTDYQKLLANKDVQAVLVATPTHLHKQIVLDALAAGKHVYCEAPLAATIEDSRAIAQAAQKAVKQYFQAGLLSRTDPELMHVLPFFRSGTLGNLIKGRGQWHKKLSWRRTSPDSEREKELNWRLEKGRSLGLIGEIGIHQVDAASWICRANPVAVSGFSAIKKWSDGREVPDSIQAVFEFPDLVPYTYEATLANSFDGTYDLYYGTDATVMIRDGRAWLFQEVDAATDGWMVYAQKNTFYKENGISLLANASKLKDLLDLKMTDPRPDDKGLPYYALAAFVQNANLVQGTVRDFIKDFGGDDLQSLQTQVAEQLKAGGKAAAGAKEGHEATVAVIKANEAIVQRGRVVFSKEWFAI